MCDHQGEGNVRTLGAPIHPGHPAPLPPPLVHMQAQTGSSPSSLLIQIKMEMTTPVLSTVAPGGGNQATNIQFVMESRWAIGEPAPSGGKGMLEGQPDPMCGGSNGIDSILAQRYVSCPRHLFE